MYKTKSKILALITLISLFLNACVFAQDTGIEGSGVVVEETREVSGITDVRLTMDAHLTLVVGDTESLIYEGEDNLLAYILTDVENGVITIQSRPRIELDPSKPINFRLTVKVLNSIEVTKTGVVEISEIDADSLEVKISDSGSLEIAGGSVKSQTIRISGSGSYNAENLECDEAEAKISSNGKATIWVNNNLSADMSGDGELRYKGNPTLDEEANSSEGVIKIGD